MRNALHSSFSAQGLSDAYPNVYFSDLAPPLSDSERHSPSLNALCRTASFSLLKRFIGIRNFGTIVAGIAFQIAMISDISSLVAYWPDRLMAFGGQLEELSALSTKALWDVLDLRSPQAARYRFAAQHFAREGFF